MGDAHRPPAAGAARPAPATRPVESATRPVPPRDPGPPSREAPRQQARQAPVGPGHATPSWKQAAVRQAPPQPAASGTMSQPLATNAPPHWPRIRAPPSFLRRTDDAFADRFMAGVRSGLERDGTLAFAEPQRRLTADGVLETPLVVADQGRLVPVFVYARADRAAAAHFVGARKMLAALRMPSPVFYAPKPLPQASATNPCVPLSPWHLRARPDKPDGEYGMWWAGPGDATFVGSRVHQAVRRVYEALDGRESFLYARLLQALGGPEVTLARAPLPPDDEPFSIAVDGPEDVVLYVTASRGKGIRFHFARHTTDPAYRDRFWTHFAAYAERLRRDLDLADANKDSFYEDRPLRWLERLEKHMRLATAGGDGQEMLVGAHIVQ